jgi:hypothetical protein
VMPLVSIRMGPCQARQTCHWILALQLRGCPMCYGLRSLRRLGRSRGGRTGNTPLAKALLANVKSGRMAVPQPARQVVDASTTATIVAF